MDMELVSIRMPLDLRVEVERRADAEQTSVSEIVRGALRDYLATPLVPFSLRTKSGRVLTDADIDALVSEAEAGYDVDELLRRRQGKS